MCKPIVVPILMLCCLLFSVTLFSQPNKNPFLNLDFEVRAGKTSARYWEVDGPGYSIRLDAKERQSGNACLRIECITPGRELGAASAFFPIEDVAGKKIRFSGYIKSKNVADGYAGLYWRVDGKNGKRHGYDNMADRGVVGTTDWKEYAIEMEIAAEATRVAFGAQLTGSGNAWFDNLRVTIDGVPYTQVTPPIITPTKTDLDWIRANAIPFKSADPQSDYGELMPLKKMVGKRHIVALGEACHGTSEFFKMKHRLTRFLAREMGFTIFAIEANMPEARAVNRYVLHGEGDPAKVLAGLYFWTWNTREVLDMLLWMREYNQSGKGKIQFYGFDIQTPDVAIKNVTAFVRKADPAFAEALEKHYKQVMEAKREAKKRPYDPDVTNWYASAKIVYDHLSSKRDVYLKSFAADEVDWAIQDANIVVQGAEMFVPDKRSRDESMAENLDWILDHSPKGSKIVTWAHNFHVNRNTETRFTMGGYLDKRHGDDMVIFGFVFGEGKYTARGKNGINIYGTWPPEPGSCEWFFKSAGIPNLILDLRLVSKKEPGSQWLLKPLDFQTIGAMSTDYAFEKEELTKEFDVLIYFGKCTPSDCFRWKGRTEKEKKEKK
ncbi:MAG: erythromycin esterase family protein [bacterium]|nr:erythromycin esterase family protein [bacterium]